MVPHTFLLCKTVRSWPAVCCERSHNIIIVLLSYGSRVTDFVGFFPSYNWNTIISFFWQNEHGCERE